MFERKMHQERKLEDRRGWETDTLGRMHMKERSATANKVYRRRLMTESLEWDKEVCSRRVQDTNELNLLRAASFESKVMSLL